MTMPIKDITDTLSTISTYYKSHVGIDLEMEMSIDNNDVMAIDYAIKALEELQAHREAWGKAKRTVKAYLMLEGFGSAYQDDIENLIEGCIPKEGDNE